jgi:hypothetical protein
MRLVQHFEEMNNERPEPQQPFRAWYERSDIQLMAMRALGALAELSEATRDRTGLTWYVPEEQIAVKVGVSVDDETFNDAMRFLALEVRFSDGKGRELKRRRHASPYIVEQTSKGVRLTQCPRLA